MKRLAAIAAVVVLVAVAAVWVLAPRSDEAVAGHRSGPEPATTPAATTPAPDVTFAAPIPETSDPDVYARAVAGVVFGLDTRRLEPGELTAWFGGEALAHVAQDGKPAVRHEVPLWSWLLLLAVAAFLAEGLLLA